VELYYAGYSASNFKDAGFSATELKPYFTLAVLANNGFNAANLKSAGFSASNLKLYFTLSELVSALFLVTELKDAGFLLSDLKPPIFTLADLVTAFSLIELKTGGFSAEDLKTSFILSELVEAGFLATELKMGGFSATELKPYFGLYVLISALFTPAELKAAGYNSAQLQIAGVQISSFDKTNFSGLELFRAGYGVDEIIAAGFEILYQPKPIITNISYSSGTININFTQQTVNANPINGYLVSTNNGQTYTSISNTVSPIKLPSQSINKNTTITITASDDLTSGYKISETSNEWLFTKIAASGLSIFNNL
jgi:uncharacterized protein YjbI with pentapeptide repeats